MIARSMAEQKGATVATTDPDMTPGTSHRRPPAPAASPRMAVRIGDIELKNPVMTASGCFGWGEEYRRFFDLNVLGALVGKAVTLQPRLGNPGVRITETVGGMLNAIGLQNPGLEGFLTTILPRLRDLNCPIIANISADSVAGYARLAEALSATEEVAGIEINVSCPNVGRGGVEFCVEPDAVTEVVTAVRRATTRTVICKLSPNVTDIVAIARAAEEAGADAVSLINTLVGMAVNVDTRTPVIGNVTAGLSGPAVKPIALRMVHEVAAAVRIPVVGIGGIATAMDALEFLVAGATAVQVGTANFFNPMACPEIIAGLRDYLCEHEIEDIRELVGTLRTARPVAHPSPTVRVSSPQP
jgi:dihydroorotate dehydrogenase (NAD+) catalytic subunit